MKPDHATGRPLSAMAWPTYRTFPRHAHGDFEHPFFQKQLVGFFSHNPRPVWRKATKHSLATRFTTESKPNGEVTTFLRPEAERRRPAPVFIVDLAFTTVGPFLALEVFQQFVLQFGDIVVLQVHDQRETVCVCHRSATI